MAPHLTELYTPLLEQNQFWGKLEVLQVLDENFRMAYEGIQRNYCGKKRRKITTIWGLFYKELRHFETISSTKNDTALYRSRGHFVSTGGV